jgi:hypothetical protein
MKCGEVDENLFEYMADTLPVDKKAAMKTHINSCPACKKSFAEHSKTWKLLGSVPSIEPRSGYIERFWESVDSRKPWHEETFYLLKEFLAPKNLVLSTMVALSLFIVSFISAQRYSNYIATRTLLTSMSEKEWEMLQNYEVISAMDKLKAVEKKPGLSS